MVIIELFRHGIIIDDREQRQFTWYYLNDIVIGWWEYLLDFMPKPIIFQQYHLPLKNILVVEFEKLLVCVVDAKLLKTIFIEILEPEYIKDTDWIIELFLFGMKGIIDFIEYELKYCIIDSFTQSIDVGNAESLIIWRECYFFEEFFFLKQQNFL